MTAMILAAGRGTRLGRLSEVVPKILVDIAGEPLLARQLRYLRGEGVGRVVVNAHHLAEQVVAFVERFRGPPQTEVIVEERLLGTAGSVRNALPRLGDEPFFVLYGDVLTDVSLASLVAIHRERHADATIAVYASSATAGKGIVRAGADGVVTGFVEKPRSAATRRELINAGIYVVEPALVSEFVAPAQELDFGHDLFPAAVEAGRRIVAFELPAPVLDIGTPAALAEARSRFGERKSS